MTTLRHWINGKYQLKATTSIERCCPSDADAISKVPIASSEDIADAVRFARSALNSWQRVSIAERCRLVGTMSNWLSDQYGSAGEPTPLKRLICDQVGKPLPEADIEVIETSDFLRYYAEIGQRVLEPRIPMLDKNLWPTKKAIVTLEPVGVVAIIKPWNYPLEMIGWSLGPALVAGNTCIIKPSEKSALVGDIYAKMASEIGIPAGVINVIHGDGSTGAALASNRGVDMVSFTGSIRAGRHVARTCADRLARYTLELSGNDAAIVLADADLETAANGVVWGAFCNAGQVCVGIKRVLVAKEIHDEFVSRVVALSRGLVKGRDYGPIIDEIQLDSIEQLVEDAVSRGASLLTGGIRDGSTTFYPPTILTHVASDTNLLKDECFGPIMPIVEIEGTEEAIRLANSSDYGLGASVWTMDLAQGETIAHQLNVGMVWINDVNIAVPQAPWAGWKQSGTGFELGEDAIAEYTKKKHVNVELSKDQRRAWWYPYG